MVGDSEPATLTIRTEHHDGVLVGDRLRYEISLWIDTCNMVRKETFLKA